MPSLHPGARRQRAWCGDYESLVHVTGFSQETRRYLCEFPVPDLEDTQGVTGPSGAEVAAQHSSSSRQPAQAVERSMMSNYVLLLQHSCTGRFKWLFPDIA